MTRESLGSRLGIIALLGALPTACADDITNPFDTSMETETEGDGTTTAPTSGDDDDDDDDNGTSSGGTTGTTMAVDDTADTTAGDDDDDDDDSTSDSGGTTTMGDDSTSTGGSESDSSSSDGGSDHIPCPADVIPTDMGLPVTVSGSSQQQDSEFGGTCGGGGAPDYTFEFTAPADGDYIFDTFQSTFDTVLYVLDGMCAGEELTCDDDGLTGTNQSLASVSLTEGQTVTVVVDAFGLSGGNITLTVREGSVACPVEEITTVPTAVTGQTVVATDEFFGSCGAGNAPDQGYLFTAPEDGTYTFEISNNDFDTVLYLLDGNCEGAELICNDNLPGALNGESGLTYPMAMGEQVTVIVDGFFEVFGNFDLNIGMLEGDCPDEDLGAMVPPFTVSGTTVMEDNASAGTCGGLSSADWAYTWTAPADATYRFATENTDFDTVLYVQDGNDCLGEELACNNDTPLGTDAVTHAFVAQDQTVTVVVDGQGSEGTYDLTVDVDCPAQDLGSTVPQTITDNNSVASDVFNASCGSGGSPEEVYTFTAPEDATYIFETLNNDFDTILFVLDAVCSGNELACNDNSGGVGGQSGLAIGLLQDQTVSIGIEGFFGAVGNYDLSITQLDGTCPDEDLGDTGVPFMTSGDTSMADNGAGGTCGGLGDVDYSYTWIAPFDGTFMFSTDGSAYNTVVYVHDGPTCGGIELACNDDFDFGVTFSTAVVQLLSGQEVTVTVDGANGESGAYDLTIDETSDCCFSHPYTGCDDPVVEACVCALDGFCCATSWDGLCADEAVDFCMADCT